MTSICEKRPINGHHHHQFRESTPESIERHLHSTVRLRNTKRFKNKFPTAHHGHERRNSGSCVPLEESPSSHHRLTSGTYYRDGREHSPEDEIINIDEIIKEHNLKKHEYSNLARAFSKTAPLKSDLVSNEPKKSKNNGAEEFGDLTNNIISDRGETISPHSNSRKSSYRQPDNEEAEKASKDSSMEVVGSPKDQKKDQPQLRVSSSPIVNEAKIGSLAEKFAEKRQHIKDEFAMEKGKGSVIASEDIGGRAIAQKHNKVPVRRVKSILKKSRTNKPSPESSQSKSRGKQVQFNRFKEVLTYYREKQ